MGSRRHPEKECFEGHASLTEYGSHDCLLELAGRLPFVLVVITPFGEAMLGVYDLLGMLVIVQGR